jgi:hypothetical protein
MASAEATLAGEETSDEPEFQLATLPPTLGQRRLALAVAALLLAAFGIPIPFASAQLPRVGAFIPSLLASFASISHSRAAVLSILDRSSRALLVLASDYLFAALIAIPWALTFPQAFSPTGSRRRLYRL